MGGPGIFGHASALVVQVAQHELCFGVLGASGFFEPLKCGGVILGDMFALHMQIRQGVLGFGVTLFGRLLMYNDTLLYALGL